MDKPYDVTFHLDMDGTAGDKTGDFTVRIPLPTRPFLSSTC